MIKKLSKLISSPTKSFLRDILKILKYGGNKKYCPVCSRYSSKFASFGSIPRNGAKCVWCGALERQRLSWLFLKRKTDLFSQKQNRKMLHVAPESCIENRLRKEIGKGYITADLFSKQVDIKMDITKIQLPENTFDIIYCSHVFEHVADDKKAISEIYRVLKGGGWAVLLVPVTCEKTFEDPNITDKRERLRLFGHEDHVRIYG